jgi:ATP-dependent RNA helicase SUPV3L1/SUV3
VGEVLQKLGFRLERIPLARTEERPAEEGDVAPLAASAPAAHAPNGEAAPVAAENGAAPSEESISVVAETSVAGEIGLALEASVAPEAGVAPEASVAPETSVAPERAREKTAAESKMDEVWRPRRQGRQGDRARRRGPAAEPPKDDGHLRRGKEPRHKRHDRHERRQGPPGRREDRPRAYRHSASPAPKGGVDPDSPFAALSSLKAALEKQNQE